MQSAVIAGDAMMIEVQTELAIHYENIQIDLFETAVANPTPVWGSGVGTGNSKGPHRFSVDTSHMKPGIYEVRIVGIHNTPSTLEPGGSLFFQSGKNFERTFFEVCHSCDPIRDKDDISNIVFEMERRIEAEFLSGINISNELNPSKQFYIFAFTTEVNISQRMRFDRWEIIPYRGLDGKDLIDLVNEFMVNNTATGIHFEYSNLLSSRLRQQSPTCIAHFPCIFGVTEQQALDYVTSEVNNLMEVLALFRGGAGRIFNIVILDVDTGAATVHTPVKSYRGNLLTGHLAGESPDQIALFLARMKSASFRYVFSQYREALAENNPAFQYVRYWQILETMAESKNYDPTTELFDISGTPILDFSGRPMRLKNAKPIVYQLLRESYAEIDGSTSPTVGQMTSTATDGTEITYSLWDFVQAWHGMRNAAAHYGGFRHGDTIQVDKFRDYSICERVYQATLLTNHDFVLSSLKETIRLVIMKEVNRTT
jgi:hypothetical protein